MKAPKYEPICNCGTTKFVNPTVNMIFERKTNKEVEINLVVTCPVCKKEYIRIY